jgi:YHS domain-containing protein
MEHQGELMKVFMAIVAAAGLLAGVGCGNGNDPSKPAYNVVQGAQSAEKVKDPVCGMSIDKSTAKAHEEYKGGHYYFCSSECHSKFKDAPDKYAK